MPDPRLSPIELPAIVTPAEFLGVHVAKRLATRRVYAEKTDARLVFVLEGDGGGTWSIVTRTGTVVQGAIEDPHCVVRIPVDDFAALMAGTLDDEQSRKDGRLRIEGDHKELAVLAKLLS